MSAFKCKMCGGTLEIKNNSSITTCEYCGTQQTLPKLDDDRRVNLYDRANHFRRNNEFDKAIAIYEQILNEDNTDAEAFWSLVLCRYGIEYVEDPLSHKRVPTIHRVQFTSIFDDDNYKMALKNADMHQRILYEEEAKVINEIQKDILAISSKEEPFDVFICYKETDDTGKRTHDSVLAQDLYYLLTQEGFKVFFAKVTLEDKLGSAYEPYIFAALNSAKVMVVLGTKPEYFNAVWVKSEWSRYLSLIKNGEKKMLIPAYKDMDPYDLPDEFSHLQAQDMSKLGFMQDLIRGIKKITKSDEPKTTVVKEAVMVNNVSGDIAPLLKRGQLYLEDKDWAKANEYFERVLDISPECADAYLGKLMVELRVSRWADLKDNPTPLNDSNNYAKVLRYGDKKLVYGLEECNRYIINRNEQQRLESIYNKAVSLTALGTADNYYKAAEILKDISHYRDAALLVNKYTQLANEIIYNDSVELMRTAHSSQQYIIAKSSFLRISGYNNADSLAEECDRLAKNTRTEEMYQQAIRFQLSGYLENIKSAQNIFIQLRDYKDSNKRIEECEIKIHTIETNKEQAKRERAKQLLRMESFRNWGPFLLCMFLGFLGVHKFREGKKGLGFLYLCTVGLLFIGWIVDTCRYIGNFRVKLHKIIAIIITVLFFAYFFFMAI